MFKKNGFANIRASQKAEWYNDDFLSLLPFQEGDKVKDKNGNIFIIERLKSAMSLGKNEIKVHFFIRKIKKNGEPYKDVNQAWGIDYFSLEKVVE